MITKLKTLIFCGMVVSFVYCSASEGQQGQVVLHFPEGIQISEPSYGEQISVFGQRIDALALQSREHREKLEELNNNTENQNVRLVTLEEQCLRLHKHDIALTKLDKKFQDQKQQQEELESKITTLPSQIKDLQSKQRNQQTELNRNNSGVGCSILLSIASLSISVVALCASMSNGSGTSTIISGSTITTSSPQVFARGMGIMEQTADFIQKIGKLAGGSAVTIICVWLATKIRSQKIGIIVLFIAVMSIGWTASSI